MSSRASSESESESERSCPGLAQLQGLYSIVIKTYRRQAQPIKIPTWMTDLKPLVCINQASISRNSWPQQSSQRSLTWHCPGGEIYQHEAYMQLQLSRTECSAHIALFSLSPQITTHLIGTPRNTVRLWPLRSRDRSKLAYLGR